MAFVFNFPDVGEGIHEGRVVEWLVSPGDVVTEDETLLKVETDKAVVELPSPKAGTVLELHAEADATIHVGDPLVSIGAEGEDAGVEQTQARAPGDEAEQVEETEASRSADVGGSAGAAPAARRPLATPRTRQLARRLGVDLQHLEGSGPGGRITDQDVEQAAAGDAPAEPAGRGPAGPEPVHAQVARAAAAPPRTASDEVERVPLTHLRKVISGAMHASKQTAAHVTHVDEADVTELVDHHRRIKKVVEEQQGVRLTLLPFFIKALVTALKQYPQFNATVDTERGEMLLKRFYNIGVAVDTPEGLIVPVLKDADGKDMVTIAREVADLAERARQRRLSLEELRGGTCTITNIGPLGGVFATPIINQPELAIVGLHRIQERPAVVDGEIAIRRLMYLSVSFDHRWIDGADAARFMTTLVGLVSDPAQLLVRM